MSTSLDTLRKYWKYAQFRPQQEEIIASILEGRDVLALLPTSGGKSICFQVPAMMMDGICLVITPLIALMKDQVAHLTDLGIAAVALSSALSADELNAEMHKIVYGDYKFVYVSPERLESSAFADLLAHVDVCLLAVDEAHCISQWGYDFRPPYLRIANARQIIGRNVPALALSASATPRVQEDIVAKLAFKNFRVFRQSFVRPNLSFQVFRVESKINKLTELLDTIHGSAIVYCKSRRRTQEMADILVRYGYAADYYHAGLTQAQRSAKQDRWMSGQSRIMVCTNAFGMGIDKADVRLVVHVDIPDSLENYYQEAGRAGRDGQPATAALLTQPQDAADLQALPDIRYPAFDIIKNVYRCICDYLQVPVGGGGEMFFDFDLRDFALKFRFNAVQTLYCLQELGRQDFLQFNESVFLPSKIRFDIDKASLQDFETGYPQFSRVIKCLLRLYEGVFDIRVSVFEQQVARYCHYGEEQVNAQLQALAGYGVIEYLPKKETPQVYFPHNRAQADYLNFDHGLYNRQKENFRRRIAQMLAYVHLDDGRCRAVFIATYFGDTDVTDCGICDHCKAKANTKLKDMDLTQKMLEAIPSEGLELKAFLALFADWDKVVLGKNIRYLEAERKIAIQGNKIVRK